MKIRGGSKETAIVEDTQPEKKKKKKAQGLMGLDGTYISARYADIINWSAWTESPSLATSPCSPSLLL